MHPKPAESGRHTHMKTTIAAAILLTILMAAQAASTQTNEVPASISPAVFSKIVETILRDEFKPADEAKTIYISDRLIEASWLPKVDNVEFVMLNDKQFDEHGNGYLFNEAKLEEGILRVDFGFGELHCSATGGSSFSFRSQGTNSSGWTRMVAGAVLAPPEVVRGGSTNNSRRNYERESGLFDRSLRFPYVLRHRAVCGPDRSCPELSGQGKKP